MHHKGAETLTVKNLSAASRHLSRPSISVFREERKKGEERCAVFPLENAALVKKKYTLRVESKPTAPTFCVSFFRRDTFNVSF